jgi:hypothetical protein
MNPMHIPQPVAALERDLRGIFGPRLLSVVVYGTNARIPAAHHEDAPSGDGSHGPSPLTHTLAIVNGLSTDDLRACSARMEAWEEAGLATPLLVAESEFGRALDAFPFEFGAILEDYTLVAGSNPFEGLTVKAEDVRRACEVQARGHLLHLREGYLETRGRSDALAVLLVESAPAFAALVTSVARLDAVGTTDPAAAARHVERRLGMGTATVSEILRLVDVSEIPSPEAERLFAPYLDTVERLVRYIDSWRP